MDKEWFKRRLDKLLREKGWTKCRLNDEAGLSAGTIYQWYNTDRIPSSKGISAICRALRISVAEFYADEELDLQKTQDLQIMLLLREMNESEKNYVIQMMKGVIELGKRNGTGDEGRNRQTD